MANQFVKPVVAVTAFLALTTAGFLSHAAGAPDTTALKTTSLYITYDGRKGLIQDGGKSADWEVAAGKGDILAAYNLGVKSDIGDGVPADKAAAVKWYRQAADKGHDYAQYNLGRLIDKGDGAAKDSVEAVKLYRLSAEQGVAQAQTNLGAHYGNGDGVERNNVQAYMWSKLGADQGNVAATRNLETLAKRLTAAELTEAQRLATEWKPKAAAPAGSARSRRPRSAAPTMGGGPLWRQASRRPAPPRPHLSKSAAPQKYGGRSAAGQPRQTPAGAVLQGAPTHRTAHSGGAVICVSR